MGKPKAKHTPAAVEKMAAQPPLDDDQRWTLMGAAHQRWTERTQDSELAVIELMKALAHDLPCMKRSVTGERTLIAPAMWGPDHLMVWLVKDGLRVVERVHPGESAVLTVRGWFYVWKPDLDRILPPPAVTSPVEHDDASDEPPRVKPGKKPVDEWPTLIAQWLIMVLRDEPHRLQNPNVSELAIEAKLFWRNQNKWMPKDNKAIEARIRVLLTPVRF